MTMKLRKIIIIIFFFNFAGQINMASSVEKNVKTTADLTQGKEVEMENPKITMKLKYGEVKIELFNDVAPNHVKRILTLSREGKYDGVAFHRVIDGFMAQTGDVQHGNTKKSFNLSNCSLGVRGVPPTMKSVCIVTSSRLVPLSTPV